MRITRGGPLNDPAGRGRGPRWAYERAPARSESLATDADLEEVFPSQPPEAPSDLQGHAIEHRIIRLPGKDAPDSGTSPGFH